LSDFDADAPAGALYVIVATRGDSHGIVNVSLLSPLSDFDADAPAGALYAIVATRGDSHGIVNVSLLSPLSDFVADAAITERVPTPTLASDAGDTATASGVSIPGDHTHDEDLIEEADSGRIRSVGLENCVSIPGDHENDPGVDTCGNCEPPYHPKL
jgi:hypothetical protein